jgi:hypothetical protein
MLRPTSVTAYNVRVIPLCIDVVVTGTLQLTKKAKKDNHAYTLFYGLPGVALCTQANPGGYRDYLFFSLLPTLTRFVASVVCVASRL